ncbi:MAG: peptidoglycan-associated lipoprotein Pal [Bdellovibrionota bacterium]
MMMKTFNRFGLGTALAMAMVLGACSKKNTKDDGDTAAGDASMNVTDLGAGSSIPELPAVYFTYDSFSLDQTAKSALGGHAAYLKGHAGVNVQVEGHTDERGTTEYNLALGERRAAAVRDYLISLGVDANRLSTISYGEERPAVSGASNEATWSRNRRGEFVLAN